jgi:uncharacterized membrane protein
MRDSTGQTSVTVDSGCHDPHNQYAPNGPVSVAVVPRNLIAFLVVAICVLLVGFAVVAVGYALANALGESLGVEILWWTAAACLLLFVVALVLLVIALALNDLHDPGTADPDDGDRVAPPIRRHEDLE